MSTALDPGLFASYEETDNAYVQTYWERSRSSDDSLRLQYYYTFYDVDDDEFFSLDLGELFGISELDGVVAELDLDRGSRSTRQELEIQRVRRIGRGHRLAFGAALRRDTVQGEILFGDRERRAIDTQRLFAHSEFQSTARLTLNSGLLVENNSLSGVSVAPRAALIFAATPGQRWRLGYSRGVRSPLLLEEEGSVAVQYTLADGTVLDDVTIFDKGRIKPETSHVIDVGYLWMDPRAGYTLNTRVARHELNGLIANRRENGIDGDTFDQVGRFFENRFDVSYSNAEIEISAEPRPDLRLRASYSYAFGQDSDLENRQLIPQHTLSLFGSFRLDRNTTLSSEYYYTSDWIWDDVRDISNRDRLDVRLARSLQIGKLEATFSIQAELELNDNVDYLERNEVDDQYFASVSLQLP